MIAVDEILHDNLDSWISEIRSNPSILNQIFEGRTVERIEAVKQYIASNEIRTVYHHPRDDTEWPCYAIVLESSAEAEQVIGQSGDAYDEILVSRMEDGWIGSDSDILRDNIYAPVTVKQFYSTMEIKDGRRSCHLVGSKGTSEDKGIFIDFRNSVLEGGRVSLVGKNYVTFWIKSNRVGGFLKFGFGKSAQGEYEFPFNISVRNLWERIRVDIRGISDSEKSSVRYMSFVITDDSQDIDVYIDELKGELTYGTVMEEVYLNNVYRVESWSVNADLTLVLYQIILWNLLKYRAYLETSWGLYEQRVEGGDIMPRPELYPAFVYVRGLTYSCKTIELVPRETELVALDVKVGRTDFGY